MRTLTRLALIGLAVYVVNRFRSSRSRSKEYPEAAAREHAKMKMTA